MKEEDLQKFGEILGQAHGETLIAIIASIKAVARSQPGFDAKIFNENIVALINHPNATDVQKAIWTAFID